MRELKFRAWFKKDNIFGIEPTMAYQIERCFHDAGYTADGKRCELKDFHGFNEVLSAEEDGDLILMQYTGLKDKNGKEIYEGDILKNKFEVGGHKFEHTIQVIWICDRHNVGFATIPSNPYEYSDIGKETTERYEVIGNIYENPELLEK